MADIGLVPPVKGSIHSRAGVTTDALCKFGSIVKSAGTANHADVVTSTTAGDTGVYGVVRSQGDPNNSNLFASGEIVDCQDMGDAQVLVLGGVSYVVGDPIITSTTAGVGKKLAAETGADIVGYSRQNVTTGSSPQLISVFLDISRRGS